MKCKDCTVDCHYKTSDGEKECVFQNHIIQLPDEWRYIRIQAAIAAMQGIMNFFGSIDYNDTSEKVIVEHADALIIAKLAVEQADALIKELKNKQL